MSRFEIWLWLWRLCDRGSLCADEMVHTVYTIIHDGDVTSQMLYGYEIDEYVRYKDYITKMLTIYGVHEYRLNFLRLKQPRKDLTDILALNKLQ